MALRARMLSESELIGRIRELVEAAGASASAGLVVASGDDATVTVASGAAVTSVDSLVEGVHFRRSTFPLRAVGRKALAAALSDLAAMGADPGEAYVQLGLPDDLDDEGCLELASGLAEAAGRWGVAVAGGDVTSAPCLIVGLTVVGYVAAPEDAVARGGARPGDVLALTGELGGAAAGLLLLERDDLVDSVAGELADRLRGRQLEPTPRLAAGRALAGAGVTAMIDVSDGLGGDAEHVADAAGARLVIDTERVPVAEGVAEVACAAGLDGLKLALEGGEDYELLAALPREGLAAATAAVEATGAALTAVGRVEGGAGVVFQGPDRGSLPAEGFDQRRPRVPG